MMCVSESETERDTKLCVHVIIALVVGVMSEAELDLWGFKTMPSLCNNLLLKIKYHEVLLKIIAVDKAHHVVMLMKMRTTSK